MLACSLDDILFPKTFHVTKTADTADGECSIDDCSLREAVIASNETAGHNEIVIPAGTYPLTITGAHFTEDGPDALGLIGDLDLSDGVDIHGAGWSTVIEGEVADDLRFRAFEVYAGIRVEMRDLSIHDAHSELGPGGGAILNQGDLTLTHVALLDNGSYQGGAIYNHASATLTVTGGVISYNSAHEGGAIYNRGIVIAQNSMFTQNVASNGGALFNDNNAGASNTIQLSNVTISANRADYGGGISNHGMLTADGLTLAYNTACNGGGLYNTFGTATLTGAFIDHNDVTGSTDTGCGAGGGITSVGTLTIEQSTIYGNTAYNSGGIQSVGALTLVNVTIAYNSAADLGVGYPNWGGLVTSGIANVTNSTISQNGGSDGTGIHILDGVINLKNTIVANNAGPDCSGTGINSLGHNLDSENTCGFAQPGDLINTDPVLGPFTFVDSIPMFALLAGSPAIDTGDNAGCPGIDQRGAPRPFGPACDIGAYEFGAPVPVPRQLPPTFIGLTGTITQDVTPTPTPINTSTFTATFPPPALPTWTHTLEPTLEPSDTPEPTATPTLFIIINVTKKPPGPSPTAIP